MKKKTYYYQNSPKKEIELAIAVFLSFHDYIEQDSKKKNDGCLDYLIKKVIHITKYPERYKEKVKMVEVESILGKSITSTTGKATIKFR